MSNDQAKALRCACTVMKDKQLKYDIQVRIIAIVVDLRFKL